MSIAHADNNYHVNLLAFIKDCEVVNCYLWNCYFYSYQDAKKRGGYRLALGMVAAKKR